MEQRDSPRQVLPGEEPILSPAWLSRISGDAENALSYVNLTLTALEHGIHQGDPLERSHQILAELRVSAKRLEVDLDQIREAARQV